MPQKDHMHSPGVRFHQLGLWGSDVINDLGWNLMSFGTIIKFLGHHDVSRSKAKNRNYLYLLGVKILFVFGEFPTIIKIEVT